jgi:hypothetical protein
VLEKMVTGLVHSGLVDIITDDTFSLSELASSAMTWEDTATVTATAPMAISLEIFMAQLPEPTTVNLSALLLGPPPQAITAKPTISAVRTSFKVWAMRSPGVLGVTTPIVLADAFLEDCYKDKVTRPSETEHPASRLTP